MHARSKILSSVSDLLEVSWIQAEKFLLTIHACIFNYIINEDISVSDHLCIYHQTTNISNFLYLFFCVYLL